MAILESVRELASKLGAETNGRDITDQLNKINKHLDEAAHSGRDIAEAVKTYSENASGGGGGGEIFEVIFSSSDFVEWTANKSYAETLSAIENGDNVLFKFVAYGESADSTGYYLFVEENHPENDKIIMIAMSSAYTSSHMSTMFLKWSINDEIAMIQLNEQS